MRCSQPKRVWADRSTCSAAEPQSSTTSRSGSSSRIRAWTRSSCSPSRRHRFRWPISSRFSLTPEERSPCWRSGSTRIPGTRFPASSIPSPPRGHLHARHSGLSGSSAPSGRSSSRRESTGSGQPSSSRRALARGEDVWLTPTEVRALLAAYGIPFVAERDAASSDEAVEAARELGFPVAVKSAVPGAHKTDTGGVALGLEDEASVRSAAERIGPPFVVQEMAAGGPELLAGVIQDPVFGPLVALGLGGSLAELVGDASFALAPLTDTDAEELVRRGRVGKLVRGFRGAPPADTAALADLVSQAGPLGRGRAADRRTRPEPRARAPSRLPGTRCQSTGSALRSVGTSPEDVVAQRFGLLRIRFVASHR